MIFDKRASEIRRQKKAYETQMALALDAQRRGDIQGYASRIAEADAQYTKLKIAEAKGG
ncbi:MAG: DUF6435 family protein [Verrucomicrobia bacterium]|nr:DUF6435 family protein [Verrucomicrobiota bacterium]